MLIYNNLYKIMMNKINNYNYKIKLIFKMNFKNY